MTINYYLDRPGSTGETAIYLFLRTGKQTIKLKTGQYIQPDNWSTKPDKNGNHVKRTFRGHVDLNGWLKNLKDDVHSLYNRLTMGAEAVSFQQLREALSHVLEKKEPQVAAGMMDHFDEFIQVNDTERTKGTIAIYKVAKNHLLEFSRSENMSLTFDSMDLRFFDLYKNYLIKKKKHTDNTLWKDFSTLKTFLNWALDRGLHQNLTFKKFRVPQKEADMVYLTEPELMKLFQADLSKSKKLDHVRDVFCFGCFTGQRYSDIANLKRGDIKGDRWVLRAVKTDKGNQVPLNAFAQAILDKYKDSPKPLPVVSSQKTNDYLKELCELLKIDEPTTLSKRRGNERLDNTQPKHEFISTHTARRTFITLSLEKGMRPEVVMRISGHSNYSTFKKYIKLSEKVTENEMNQIWQMAPSMKVVS